MEWVQRGSPPPDPPTLRSCRRCCEISPSTFGESVDEDSIVEDLVLPVAPSPLLVGYFISEMRATLFKTVCPLNAQSLQNGGPRETDSEGIRNAEFLYCAMTGMTATRAFPLKKRRTKGKCRQPDPKEKERGEGF